jgi:hypothetical protein
MYKAVFIKVCHELRNVSENSGVDIPEQFYKYIELPFPPFIGLEIHHQGGFIGPVETIRYETENDIFKCFVEPEQRVKNGVIKTLEELIDYYIGAEGWDHFTRDDRPWFW